jgi:hypothetical protein
VREIAGAETALGKLDARIDVAVIVAIGMNVYYSSSSLGSSLAIHLLAALTWGFSADALGRTIGGLWTPKRA